MHENKKIIQKVRCNKVFDVFMFKVGSARLWISSLLHSGWHDVWNVSDESDDHVEFLQAQRRD